MVPWNGNGADWHRGMHDAFGLGGGWMWLLWILLLGIVGFGAYVIAKQQRRNGPPRSNARNILEERYARGEITREEFERMKRDVGE
jgi:putative membrane protein